MADMPQQPAPDEGAAEQPMADAGGQDPSKDAGSPTKLIVGVDAGLSKVSQLLEGTQVDQKIKDGVQQALQMYREAIQSLMASGPGGDAAGQPPQGAPPAKAPAGPQGGVMGEHGSPGSAPMPY